MTLKVAVLGGNGRMGRLIASEISENSKLTLSGCSVSSNDSVAPEVLFKGLGFDIADEATLPVVARSPSEVQQLIELSDVVIDFTNPSALPVHLEVVSECATPLVIGTTGITEQERKRINDLGSKLPILYAPNMSLGIALLRKLVQKTASVLGSDFDIEINEFHHQHKKDAPSGTALSLAQAAAEGRGVKLADCAVYDRTQFKNQRHLGSIGFSVMRGGGVIGDHTVYFAGMDEVLELGHRALDRRIYARGAVRAAQWLVLQNPGSYTLQDVLGI